MENPIKRVRHERHMTQVDFARWCNVHPQAVVLSEQGCYPRILPDILKTMRGWAIDNNLVHLYEVEYSVFQRERREFYGDLYGLALFSLNDLGEPLSTHPVVQFRQHLGISEGHPFGLSRSKFTKSFCLHPAEMYSLEMGQKYSLSEQFRVAMTQAGLSATVLGEIEFRCEEYASGERLGGVLK